MPTRCRACTMRVQTLRQLVRLHGQRIPALTIRDWPSLGARGLMLDISRRKVPTVATLKHLVDELSHYKLNVLQLYTEHTFEFPRHPRIGAGCGSLSSEDILELDAYCRQQQVELMPNLQSFGHARNTLRLPEYRHLAESDLLWTLSPAVEETYNLLDELYGDMLPAFSSPTLNVDCDETYDLGQGASKELVEQAGGSRGRGPGLPAAHPAGAGAGSQAREAHTDLGRYPAQPPGADRRGARRRHAAGLVLRSGRGVSRGGQACRGGSRVLGLSGHRLVEQPLPAGQRGADQHPQPGARRRGGRGSGMLNTDWGDFGHYQQMGLSWHGYLFGAAQGWTGGTTGDEAFDAAFGPLFFGEEHEAIMKAFDQLARTNDLPGIPGINRSNTVLALFDDPLTGETVEGEEALPAGTLREMYALRGAGRGCLRPAGAGAPAGADLARDGLGRPADRLCRAQDLAGPANTRDPAPRLR